MRPLKVRAICCASFEPSVKRAAGVKPITSPPLAHGSYAPNLLEGFDLLYFKLHGLPRQPYWYGDRFLTALSAQQVAQADLSNTVVFVTNCHLIKIDMDRKEPSPMLQALLDAGARAVVGGPGPNYAGRTRVFGADILGLLFRMMLSLRYTPADALTIAKHYLRTGRQDRITRDTLEFQLFAKTSPPVGGIEGGRL